MAPQPPPRAGRAGVNAAMSRLVPRSSSAERATMKIEDRFLKRVIKSPGCWIWTGGHRKRSSHDYGSFWFKGRNLGAHKVAFMLFVAPVPIGILVRHSCDNIRCVNPAHLLLGSQKENMADCLQRGRFAVARHPSAKLSPEKILEMRGMARSGLSFAAIAKQFGVDRKTATDAVRGRSWRAETTRLLSGSPSHRRN